HQLRDLAPAAENQQHHCQKDEQVPNAERSHPDLLETQAPRLRADYGKKPSRPQRTLCGVVGRRNKAESEIALYGRGSAGRIADQPFPGPSSSSSSTAASTPAIIDSKSAMASSSPGAAPSSVGRSAPPSPSSPSASPSASSGGATAAMAWAP